MSTKLGEAELRGFHHSAMAPPKKSKKPKRKSKDSAASGSKSTAQIGPAEAKNLETEWWYSFLQKQSDSGNFDPFFSAHFSL